MRWVVRSGMFLMVVLCSVIVFSSIAGAIGVSPPSHRVNYAEGETLTFDLYILDASNPVNMSVSGAFVDNVELSETDFSITGGQQKVTATLTFPPYDTLTEFGPRRINIKAREQPRDAVGFSATAAVTHVILVQVPLPGQYAELGAMSVPSVNEGQDTKATIKVINRGTEYLESASLSVNVYDMEHSLKETLQFNDISIPPQETTTLSREVGTSSFVPGKYRAEAVLFYAEDKTTNKAVDFFVGTTDIELVNHTEVLTAGKINKLELSLQSLWGSSLNNIRVSYDDVNGQEQFLPVLDFESFEEKTVSTFIEIPMINETSWQTTLYLAIPDANLDAPKELPLSFKISLPEDETSGISTSTLLIAGGLILLLALAVFMTLYLSKRKDKAKKS